MSSRGITDIILNGEAFELHPTFSNLDKLETVLNKGAIGFLRQDLSSGAFKAGDVVSIIQVCAVPANGRKFPNWWNKRESSRNGTFWIFTFQRRVECSAYFQWRSPGHPV